MYQVFLFSIIPVCSEIGHGWKMIGDVEFGDDLFEEEEILSDRPGEFCRKQCSKCLRPVSVCLCANIVSPKVKTKARVVVIQKGLRATFQEWPRAARAELIKYHFSLLEITPYVPWNKALRAQFYYRLTLNPARAPEWDKATAEDDATPWGSAGWLETDLTKTKTIKLFIRLSFRKLLNLQKSHYSLSQGLQPGTTRSQEFTER